MELLSRKTEQILKIIKENSCKYYMFSFRTSSDDPNWERLLELEEKEYVLTQPAEMGPPTYFVSPKGEVYLQNVKEHKKERVKNWIGSNIISIFSLIISIIAIIVSTS